MMYLPSNSVVERLRALFKRRVRDSELAYLGDHHGAGARVDVPGKPGFVYVHFANGKDENGYALYSPPTIARSGSAAYVNAPGMPVHVAYNRSNELEIVGTVNAALDAYGIDTRVLNPLNQQSKWVYPWQLTYGLANAVANAVTESTLITVKSFRHYVGNVFQTFATPDVDAKIDVVLSIPAEGEHCFAAIWIDTYTNEYEVTSSTPQPIEDELDETDIQECVADRPPDAMPLKAFRLSNAQTTVRQSSQEADLRQHMATPHVWGFPNVLTTRERVRPNRTLVTGPYTVSGAGDIEYEAGAQHIIVHKSNIAASAPTVDDDSTLGYSIGSLWFDTATGLLYVATDVTEGAAVWDEVASSGGGITQLTGDVTAGPGSGSQVATIPNNTITQAKMADASVGTAEIIDANVTNAKLATDAVTQAKIANDAVGTAELIDGNVTNAKLATDAVTQVKIANNAVGTAEIIDQAVQTAKIQDFGVTTVKINDGAVTATKIEDGAVTDTKIGAQAVYPVHIADQSAYSIQIWDGAGEADVIPLTDLFAVEWYYSISPGSHTWTKPDRMVYCDVILVAGGSGGGSGRKGLVSTSKSGGAGGAAGGVTQQRWSASELPSASYDVVVGGGGPGGAASAVSGNNGNAGGDSYFGGTTEATALQTAKGSPASNGGGAAGTSAATSTGGTGLTTFAPYVQFYGANGGDGVAAGAAGAGGRSAVGPGAGGGGSGRNAANTAGTAGAGGKGNGTRFGSTLTGGGGAVNTGASGSNGADGLVDGTGPITFGGGGAGGDFNVTTASNGGNGGVPGGGGGGGAASQASDSGEGGDGAVGAVIIIAYCIAP